MSSRYLSLVRCSTLALFALSGFGFAACGGGDAAPTKPVSQMDGGEPDSGGTVKRDAGQMTSKPDTGSEPVDSGNPFKRDAGRDSGSQMVVDAGDSGGGGDIDPTPVPPPESWKCAEAIWRDGYCDCGCGATDVDCVGQTCSEPGCISANCDACYTTELAWKSCDAPPDPSAWTCGDDALSNMLCDCGCGVPDPECRGSGCSEPGCWRGVCDLRHDADGIPLADQRPPTAWLCPSAAWGGGNGCDCGCGAPDPDCQSANNCTQPKCNNSECLICHDGTGRVVPCSDALAGWTCDPQRFGSGDGCDCGCGTADPDCMDKGCTDQGCTESACTRCTSSRDNVPANQLGGCAPAEWKCDPSHFGTGDGCDCGCSIPDPDCGSGNGCPDIGCQNDKCDYCHNDDPAFGGYMVCNGWTCGTVDDAAWKEPSCDCGCGKPDPFCREYGYKDCSEAGCKTAACQFCKNGNDVHAECDGPKWTTTGTCTLRSYGLDGKCDCGCGAIDPDCGQDEGCTAPFCAAEGCDICHGAGTRLATCYAWACPKEAYSDGKCDCGCGAPDPDCSNLGCSEPGCRGETSDICEVCHDPFGRTVTCP